MSDGSELDKLLELVNAYSRGVVLEDGGCRVLISERGARVLGLFLDSKPNLLWVNPKVEKIFSEGGWNLGGLRLWISPERNFFYKKPETFDEWFCPEGIDPGDYRLTRADSKAVFLEGRISAYDHILEAQLNGYAYREIRLLESDKGYLRLRIREGIIGEYPARVNPWVLAQVPMSYAGAGTVIIPTKKNAEPIHYFGEIPKDRLRVLANHISFKIDGEYVSKLGVKPEDLREPGLGAIAYLFRIDKRTWASLILKSQNIPLSQEDCLDVAKADPNLPRAAIQSYNSGPEAFPDVKFGEIELQLAPTINISGRIFASAEYDVIAFIGRKNMVLNKLRRTLNVARPKLY